jgi:hypothetical protein
MYSTVETLRSINSKPFSSTRFSIMTLSACAGMLLLGISRPAQATPAPVVKETFCAVPTDLSARPASVSLAPITDRSLIASISGATEAATEYPMMDFSAAESDAAVALFGCDCLPCINALRQLRNQSFAQMVIQSGTLQASNQGHCWSSLQQRRSSQEVEDVLQQLEAIEMNS